MAFWREPGVPTEPAPPSAEDLLRVEAELADVVPLRISFIPIIAEQQLGGTKYFNSRAFDGLSLAAHEAIAYKHLHGATNVSPKLDQIRTELGEAAMDNARSIMGDLIGALGFQDRSVVPAEYAKPIADAVRLHSPEVYGAVVDLLATYIHLELRGNIFPQASPQGIAAVLKDELTAFNDTGKSNAAFVEELIERSKKLLLERARLS